MIQAGDVFYTKTARTGPSSAKLKLSYVENGYKGHVIAVALGHLKQDEPKPDENVIRRLVHACGLFSGDDIIEAFGEEAFEEFCGFVNAKYPAVE